MKGIRFNDPVTSLHGKIRDIFPVGICTVRDLKNCCAQKHGKDLIKSCEVRPGQDWHQNSGVNGREGIVSTRCSGKTITGRIRRQGKIGLRVEVDGIEGMVAYRRSRFEGGTDLIPPY